MSATIKDVAKKAGVSIATVSLVIHNNKRISNKTRSKVLKTIEELNYYPSRSARVLVSKRTGNIGFILRDDHFSLSEPFYTKIFLGTEFQAREDEYYVLLTTVPSSYALKDPLPRFVLERNIDGVILAGAVPDTLIHNLATYSTPLVFVDYYPSSGDYSAVLIDNIAGGVLATSHLIEIGHRRIAFLAGDIGHPSITERFLGYKEALIQAGIPFDPLLTIVGGSQPSRANGYQAAAELYKQASDFTAIFACNDAMAIGVLQYLKESNIRVPADISVIGFDDVDADLMVDPQLSTIRVPKEELGSQALQAMVEMLSGKSVSPKKILVPVEIVLRASTGKLTHQV